jgi:hypothetical protein
LDKTTNIKVHQKSDAIWINFKEKVLKAIDETVPTKLINNTKKKLPWITTEINTEGTDHLTCRGGVMGFFSGQHES